jgi:hypothetical protein
MEAAVLFVAHTPLPGQAIDEEEIDTLADGELPSDSSAV